jgi:hypothetical protein
VRRFEPLRLHHSSRAKEGRGEARSARAGQVSHPMGVTACSSVRVLRPGWGYHSASWLLGDLAHAGSEHIRRTPANKRMKLTRPGSGGRGVGALQLIRGVRWTRWSGSAPDRNVAVLEAGTADRSHLQIQAGVRRPRSAWHASRGLLRSGSAALLLARSPSLRAEAKARHDRSNLGRAKAPGAGSGSWGHACRSLNSLCLLG